jgi:ATP-dependent RNA helicase DDX47/RRP3
MVSGALSEADHAAAVKAFEALGICTQLAEAAASLGWKSPTAIQEQAIPSVLSGVQQPYAHAA